MGLIYLNHRSMPEELSKLYPPEFYNTDVTMREAKFACDDAQVEAISHAKGKGG